MSKVFYVNFSGEVTDLQKSVLEFIDFWVKHEKTPVPKKRIVLAMGEKGIDCASVSDALDSIKKKGYIRKAHIISNETMYVMLRTI